MGRTSFLFLYLLENLGICGVILSSDFFRSRIDGITEWSGRDGFVTFGNKKLGEADSLNFLNICAF